MFFGLQKRKYKRPSAIVYKCHVWSMNCQSLNGSFSRKNRHGYSIMLQ